MDCPFAYDAAAAAGRATLCGVDEAGRGPLAGPVVTAAVVLPDGFRPDGIGDSKTLAEADRVALADLLFERALVVVASAGPARIDRINIRAATLWAMARAVRGLAVSPALVLVDGRDVPPGLAADARAVVGGDGLSAAVGAASIVAKVVRDRLMTRLGARFPAYGFERHKGYATPEHLAALARHGASVHHRRSFAPVRDRCALGAGEIVAAPPAGPADSGRAARAVRIAGERGRAARAVRIAGG